jgi:hypothetical protein
VSLTASSRIVTSGHPITLTGNPVIAFPSLDTACAFEQIGGHVSLSATDISQPTVTYVNGGIEIIKFRYGIRYGGTGGAYCTNSASITITSSLHRDANGNEGENGTALAENLTGLKVSPNPGKSLITIEIPEIFETAQVIITDISGKVAGISNTTEKTVAMDMSQYPAGNYIINVFTGNKKYSEKVVKE